jgi:outer membrane protein assembly factor BamB
MRRPLAFIAMLVSSAVIAHAQAPKPNQEFQARQQQEEARTQLHDVLRNQAHLHDTYLQAAQVGNKDTVPLLIERLRQDFGAVELGPPSGNGMGFDCAQIHLVDALREITNTDQGVYYPRWAAWWEVNRTLSQQQWVHNGFTAAGLHAVEPIDEQFGLELIEQMGRNQDYRESNAIRLLAMVPAEQRMKWAVRASVSESCFLRLGGVELLRRIDREGHEDLLRSWAADSDLEIRCWALTLLNDRLRDALPAPPGTVRLLRPSNKANWIRGIRFVGNLIIAAYRDGDVQAFDWQSLQVVWTRHLLPGAGDQMLVSGNRVILAARRGRLVSLDQRGHVLWHREFDSPDNEIRRLIVYRDEILVIRECSVERVDPKTGATKSRILVSDGVMDADADGSYAFFVDRHGLRSLSDSTMPEYPISGAMGISVSQASVCVTSSGDTGNFVTCFAPDTLSLQWARPTGGNGTWGHDVAPIQDESRVLVSTDQDFTALGASDGTLQWTSYAGQEAFGTTVPTACGLLLQNIHYQLELRNLANGEVRRVWPQMHGVQRIALQSQIAAAADFGGALWLINLSDCPPYSSTNR